MEYDKSHLSAKYIFDKLRRLKLIFIKFDASNPNNHAFSGDKFKVKTCEMSGVAAV